MITDECKFGIVILGAGTSKRMGRPKLLLPWGDSTIIAAQIDIWRRLESHQIAIVHRPDDAALIGELDRVKFPAKDRIANVNADEGMFSSVQAASNWTGWKPELTHCVISLGDQPHLKLDTLRAVLQCAAASTEKIFQPLYADRARHPVVLPIGIFLKLRDSEAGTLKEFVKSYDVATVEIDDPGLSLDIDEPADYEEALKLRSS